MNYTLLYPAEFDVTPVLPALESEGVVAERVESGAALVASDSYLGASRHLALPSKSAKSPGT